MDMTADQTLQESCMGALRHMGVEVTALVDKANRLEAENAELRQERDLYRELFNLTTQPDRYVQVREENAKLKKERDYLLANESPTACEVRRVRSAMKDVNDENAKLRELVRKYGEYTDQDRCEGCVCKSRCNDGDVDECWQLTEIRGLARELGIEVQA